MRWTGVKKYHIRAEIQAVRWAHFWRTNRTYPHEAHALQSSKGKSCTLARRRLFPGEFEHLEQQVPMAMHHAVTYANKIQSKGEESLPLGVEGGSEEIRNTQDD
jgi:hypothetical protein